MTITRQKDGKIFHMYWLSKCGVLSDRFVTKLNESRKLSDAPFSLQNMCDYPVSAFSLRSLIPLAFL